MRSDREAVARTLDAFEDAAVVVANGYLSREAFALGDRPERFFMLGSMGLAASIGLGVALARPERRVLVLDGDGNLLMGLGALALVGARKPANLYHVCVDNGVYASTGNQPTVSAHVALEEVARAAGYHHAEVVGPHEDPDGDLDAALARLAASPGPAFLRVHTGVAAHPRDLPRVSHTPPEIARRFSASLGGRP